MSNAALKSQAKKVAAKTGSATLAPDPNAQKGLAPGYTTGLGSDGQLHFFYQGRQLPDGGKFDASGRYTPPPGAANVVAGPQAAGLPGVSSVPGDNDGDGRVDPFFRPEDTQQMASIFGNWQRTYGDIVHTYQQMVADGEYNKTQLGTSHKDNLASIDWDAAGRGISNSSIKTGNDATENTNYTNAVGKIDSDIKAYGDYKDKTLHDFATNESPYVLDKDGNPVTDASGNPVYSPSWNQIRVNNGSTATNDYRAAQPDPAAPAAAQPPAVNPGAPAQPGTETYKPAVKNGNFYHVYNAGTPNERWVFVRKQS